MSDTNSSDFSLVAFWGEAMPNGATFLGEFCKQVQAGAVATGDIMDKLADAYVRDYQNAAATANKISEKAYAAGKQAAGELYERIGAGYEKIAAERYSMSGESYAVRQAVAAQEVIGRIGHYVGPLFDGLSSHP